MKKLLGLFLVLAEVTSAVAAVKPLVTKVSGGGHMMPEYAGTIRCDVYPNKVVITNVNGFSGPTAFTMVEERKISLSSDLKAVIEAAKAAKIVETPNMLCDGPTTSIVAGEDVGLYFTGACGSPKRVRQGLAAQKLVNLVGQFCPLTY